MRCDSMFNLSIKFFSVLKTKYICLSHRQNVEQNRNMKRDNKAAANVTKLKY
jgi:hypothetical protein